MRIIITYFILFFLIIAFQNCGDGFSGINGKSKILDLNDIDSIEPNDIAPDDIGSKSPSGSIDSSKPTIEITTRPMKSSFQSIARFEFQLNNEEITKEKVKCWVDQANIEEIRGDCESPVVFNRLLPGAHVFHLQVSLSENEIIEETVEWEITSTPGESQNLGPTLEEPFGLAVSSDQTFALVCDIELKALLHVNLSTGNREIVSSRDVGSGDFISTPLDVALSSDNKRAYVVASGRVFEVDLATKVRREIFRGSSSLLDIVIHPNGEFLYFSGIKSTHITRFKISSGETKNIPLPSAILANESSELTALVVDGQGAIYFTGRFSGHFKIDGKTLETTPMGRSYTGLGLSVSADGDRLFSSSSRAFTVRTLSQPDTLPEVIVVADGLIADIAIDPLGSQAFYVDRRARTLVRVSLQAPYAPEPVIVVGRAP